MTYLFLLRKQKRILININLFVRAKALILLLTEMNFWISKNVLMFWIPLWKSVHWIWTNLILCFERVKSKGNIRLINLTHTMKNMHNMHIRINISMLSCMAKCTHVHIAAERPFSKILLCKNIWVKQKYLGSRKYLIL